MAKPRIVILGAGPAGLGAAWQLAVQNKATVTVLEQRGVVGGNAGSFELAGLRVDYGSHRLHPACDPKILNDLRGLLGEDLLDRPRHGRIRLHGRWIHFPLKPQDLALRLPFSFSGRVAMDAVRKFIPNGRNGNGHETFTSVLEKGLGATICQDFYFPYAKKIWGVQPEKLSAIQAHKRVSAGSLGKMVKKAVSAMPGLRKPGAGRFYYPRKGYGQISEAIANAARENGVRIELNCEVKQIAHGEPHSVAALQNGSIDHIEADHVWSTIPLPVLARIIEPAAPSEVVEASEKISYRAMVLIYLVLDRLQWTPYDAHYFPETDIRLSRLSEPKNYSDNVEPRDRTILCGELPCSVDDEVWLASDQDLAKIVTESLTACGVPIGSRIIDVITKRLPFAYPIYHEGYERHFEIQDAWIEGLDRMLTFGRQGLFAHDNTHHALAMAYGAVDCLLESGEFDRQRWYEYREEFAKHVVED